MQSFSGGGDRLLQALCIHFYSYPSAIYDFQTKCFKVQINFPSLFQADDFSKHMVYGTQGKSNSSQRLVDHRQASETSVFFHEAKGTRNGTSPAHDLFFLAPTIPGSITRECPGPMYPRDWDMTRSKMTRAPIRTLVAHTG